MQIFPKILLFLPPSAYCSGRSNQKPDPSVFGPKVISFTQQFMLILAVIKSTANGKPTFAGVSVYVCEHLQVLPNFGSMYLSKNFFCSTFSSLQNTPAHQHQRRQWQSTDSNAKRHSFYKAGSNCRLDACCKVSTRTKIHIHIPWHRTIRIWVHGKVALTKENVFCYGWTLKFEDFVLLHL